MVLRWGFGAESLLAAWLAMRTALLVVEGTHKQTIEQGGSPVVKASSIAQLRLCLV